MIEATDERLQNLLAQRGIASRRGAAEMIEAGRVCVNDKIITIPGTRIPATASITIDGRTIPCTAEARHTYLYNKPAGEICSTDGQGGRTVLEAFRKLHLRLVPVGRLDKESEGLLLISNDGELINLLTHPRYNHKKVYDVEVNMIPTPQQLAILRSSLILEGYRIRPVPVTQLGPHQLRFVLSEGRHRQIRLMCEEAQLRVEHLRRISLSNLQLGDLAVGCFRELSLDEIKRIL
ncbi:MAG: pseudouridine synthase [Kiritimatiellia bacterium]